LTAVSAPKRSAALAAAREIVLLLASTAFVAISHLLALLLPAPMMLTGSGSPTP